MSPSLRLRFTLLRGFLLVAVLCGGVARSAEESSVPPLVLVSIDGFRWDYLELHSAETPNLRQLRSTGISAEALVPVYPSNTFPNHYTIVTGLYPSRHGMINNHFFDPEFGEAFHYNRAGAAQEARWWRGEPIWITAIKQGRTSACVFWVGSEAPIGGVRPTFWQPFDPKLPFAARFAELVRLLGLSESERPAIVTFYLEETNSIGHRFGPDAPELAATIRKLDDQIGEIRQALARIPGGANLVIVSDHGMTPCSSDRVVLLDDYLDLSSVQIDFDESAIGLRPGAGIDVSDILRRLSRLPPTAARAYRAEDLPSHFRIDPRNPRVPPVWIVPNEGWNIMRRSRFEAVRDRFSKGQHGYDPALPSMRGILLATGPSFRDTGESVPPVESVHVYNLLCAALRLEPAANDGDDRLVRAMLR